MAGATPPPRGVRLASCAILGSLALAALSAGCSAVSTRAQIEHLKNERLELRQERNQLRSELAAAEGQQRLLMDELDETRRLLSAARADVAVMQTAAEDGASQAEGSTGGAPSPGSEAVPARMADTTAFDALPGVTASQQGGELRITLEQELLFPPGKATVSESGRKTLDRVAETLRGSYPGARIHVAGHTDDTPVKASKKRFPSNWELSAVRACSVLRYLVERGGVLPNRCAAVGYADQRPVASNEAESGRARNRRVEILVLLP